MSGYRHKDKDYCTLTTGWCKTRKTARPSGVDYSTQWDREGCLHQVSKSLGLTTLTFDHLHYSCRDTMGTYHNMCLPGLVKICQICPSWCPNQIKEISCRKRDLWPILDLCDLNFLTFSAQIDHFMPLPCTTCSKWRHNQLIDIKNILFI